jgi:hypothetical protein
VSAENYPQTGRVGIPAAAAPLSEILAQRAVYKADAEYIAEQIERLDAVILDRLVDVGTHDVDGMKVEIREYSRTDYKALEERFPAEAYPQLYATVTSLDQGAVKKEFAPAALDEFKVRGKKSVVVK